MANTKPAAPIGLAGVCRVIPARTPGLLGLFDQGDPGVIAFFGDTPHPTCLVNTPRLPDSLGLAPYRDAAAASTAASRGQPRLSHAKKGNAGHDVEAQSCFMMPISSSSKASLGDEDFKRAAAALGCEAGAVYAVAKVESSGSGFDDKGRPKILFEAHWFHKLTKGRYDKQYAHLSQTSWKDARQYYSMDQWGRLEEAIGLDQEAAIKSASWGKFQIMGFNYKVAGARSLRDFVFAMFESEYAHLNAFIGFCQSKKLVDALKTRDWAVFAAGYNGAEYKENKYDEKMKLAYEAFNASHPKAK